MLWRSRFLDHTSADHESRGTMEGVASEWVLAGLTGPASPSSHDRTHQFGKCLNFQLEKRPLIEASRFKCRSLHRNVRALHSSCSPSFCG